jgi:hypothetical protein
MQLHEWWLVYQSSGGSLWNGSVEQIQRGWEVFLRFISFGIDDGSHIRFWHDNWCGNQPLKEAFPKLFQIACNKEAWVKDHM